jgi:DNA-binding transcriptional MerR regulator
MTNEKEVKETLYNYINLCNKELYQERDYLDKALRDHKKATDEGDNTPIKDLDTLLLERLTKKELLEKIDFYKECNNNSLDTIRYYMEINIILKDENNKLNNL